ncbi:hypothetical protein ElyMa_006414900 [Elysia marginata]|uniref:Uncharacterized protein n=1 Tax=Elysia marginata TaxID=1093978 RepID=A0AAV4HSE9_9GAST|nr:hypothetical protein ElyMa_006414900 [Elysia marginata]
MVHAAATPQDLVSTDLPNDVSRGFYSTRTLAGEPAQCEHCASRKQCKLRDLILAKKIMDNQENLKSVNSVKEVPSSKTGHVSLGRDRHVRQVTPGRRHVATVLQIHARRRLQKRPCPCRMRDAHKAEEIKKNPSNAQSFNTKL